MKTRAGAEEEFEALIKGMRGYMIFTIETKLSSKMLPKSLILEKNLAQLLIELDAMFRIGAVL